MNYPIDCNTPRERMELLLMLKLKFLKLHNLFGRWFREGIPQTAWDKIPDSLKAEFPYKAGPLTKAEWIHFKNDLWFPKRMRIIQESLKYKAMLYQSVEWDEIDWDDIE